MMITSDDFEKKQLVFIFTLAGDRLRFSNDNLIVQNGEEVRYQNTCYRTLALFIVGSVTITTVLIEKAHKFGFPIVLMTPSLRTVDVIGHRTEGNTVLHRLQYQRSGLELAKHLMINKVENQLATLDLQRGKDVTLRADMELLRGYLEEIEDYSGDLRGLMGIEGCAARAFFRSNYNNTEWKGRQPRVKRDYINSTLDIGYTLLFNYLDALLSLYGFDTYCGIYHVEFYQRKSLVCDLVEPFRPLIDWAVRRAINLGECQPEDFNVVRGAYILDIRKNKSYTAFLMKPLIDRRMEIFAYVQSYYRAFMKQRPAEQFPVFRVRE